MKKVITIFILSVILFVSCNTKAETAKNVADEFYTWLFSDTKNGYGLLDANQVEDLKQYFSSDLIKSLELAREMEKKCVTNTPKHDTPYVIKPHIIEGSILVGLHEGAMEVIVGHTKEIKNETIVPSQLIYISYGFPKGHRSRVGFWTDELVMKRENNKWIVADIRFRSNEWSLSSVLNNYLERGKKRKSCKDPNKLND